MSEKISLLPKNTIEWEVTESPENSIAYVSSDFNSREIDLDFLIRTRDKPHLIDEFERLGSGDQGVVYGVGDIAVKFLGVQHRYRRGDYGNFNRSHPINQTRIAVGLHQGLKNISRNCGISAPNHYAFMQWKPRSGPERAMQVMDRVDVDEDSPEIAPIEITSSVKKVSSSALKKVGIKPSTIYWYDLEKNIVMSSGLPVVLDLLPVDSFIRKYQLRV